MQVLDKSLSKWKQLVCYLHKKIQAKERYLSSISEVDAILTPLLTKHPRMDLMINVD